MSSTEVRRRFGENLTRCRAREGASQQELAERVGLHRTEISLMERGERCPRVEMLVKLAGSLSVRPTELFEGIAWKPPGRRGAEGRFMVASARGARAKSTSRSGRRQGRGSDRK